MPRSWQDSGVYELVRVIADMEKVMANARFAKAAYDVSMHDAGARSLGVSVRDLLAGRFRDSVDVAWALGVLPVETAIAEIEERIASHGLVVSS